MKVRITPEEWYPVYEIDTTRNDSSDECNVPEATVVRWKRITEEFGVIQKEMSEARKVAGIPD